VRVTERAFRTLLRLYPARFRREFAEDMQALFAERLAEATASGRRFRFLLTTLLNVVRAAAAERWTSHPHGQPAFAIKPRRRPMSGLAQDVRYACRVLLRQPAYAAFVIGTLAIGIGATTAVFSVVHGVLLRPLPFAESDRLVAVWGRFDPESGFDFPQFSLSAPEYLDYKTASKGMTDVAAYSNTSATIADAGTDPERVAASGVTANLFALLRVQPAIGRSFTEEEARPGGPPVILLSHGLWQSRYGGDAGVVGRTVTLNGATATVIGVMPPDFAFPRPATRLWGPLRIDPANPGSRQSHSIRALGRLAPGVTIDGARAELQGLMQDWKDRYPTIHTGHYLFIRPMLEDVVGTIRPALLVLMSATGLVLLIVCANISSVVLARGEARDREMAIRGALGAGRWALVRLSVAESGLLATTGAALGLGLAHAGVRWLVAIDPASVPRSADLGTDWTVVAFALGAAALCTVLFGSIPAFRGSRADVQGSLRAAASTLSPAGALWFRRGLVAAEVALAVVLVLGAGLMLRSFAKLLDVEPGFRPEGLVTASVSLPAASYKEPERIDAFFAQLVDRVRATPGVTAASAGSIVPLWSDHSQWDFDVEGRPAPAPGQPALNAAIAMVRPGYFETAGIGLVRGRFFTPLDDARAQPTVIVNEAMAGKFFAGDDPIGRRIRVAGPAPNANEWMTIVGVAAAMRSADLAEPSPPMYFLVQSQTPRTTQFPLRTISVFARTPGDPAPVMTAIRAAVRELDPALPVFDLQTSRSVLEQSVARPRFTTVLLALFAGVGIVLGASGVYGVLAYTVARRRREIGIRRALGAPPARVARQIILDALKPVSVGVLAGLVLSFWTTGLWRSQLFEVSPTDPLVYAGAAAAAMGVALVATLAPMRRALGIDPSVALREGL
jgi:putative ABC transport system permease protein